MTVRLNRGRFQKNVTAPYLFLIFLFVLPCYNILENVTEAKPEAWLVENMNMGIFLKDGRDGKHNIKDYTIVWDAEEPNLYWYLMADEGKNNLQGVYSHNLTAGNIAAVFKENTKKYVEKTYFSTVVRNYNGVTVYKIHGRK